MNPFSPLLLMLLSVWLLPFAGCQQAPPPKPPPPPSVTVSHPITLPVTEYHYYTGQTAAVETVKIQARVRGFLKKIHFQEGAEVKKGDPLYDIEPDTYAANLRRAEAEIDRLTAQVNLAKTEEQRAYRLRSRQATTEEEYEQRVAARQQAEAALEQSRASVDLAKLDLSYTKIVAPISGRVGRTLVTEGNLVGYNEPTQLTTIVSLDPIYVYFDVPERVVIDYQRRIREEGAVEATDRKLPVQVELEGETGYPHVGVIDFRENDLDPGTGTLLVRGLLPNPDRIINPGMFARVRVPIGAPRPQLLVPQVAIGSDQRGDFVLTVNAEGNAEYRPVATGQRIGEFIVVQEGVNPDDLVVTNGVQKARPGAKVEQQLKTLAPPAELVAAERPAETSAPR